MLRAPRFALATLAASCGLVALGTSAHAEPPNAKASPVYVLTLSTDDSDDQAEALTQALRSRVRTSQGWSLLETPQSFETLALALKCPPRPDNGCLQRIGDQLKAERFVWGTLAKGGQKGEVNAVIHMWTRGKGDADVTQAYSDNLKDAGDESLKAVAASLFGKLTGAGGAGGTLVVHAGTGGGQVLVDGAVKGTLDGGVARVDVSAGPHVVTVKVPGSDATPANATVPAGTEQEITIALAASTPNPIEVVSHSDFPVRKVLEYGAIVVGGGLLIASGVETVQFLNDKSQNNSDLQHIPQNSQVNCAAQVNQWAQDSCRLDKDARTASALAWTFGLAGAGIAAAGVYLVLTDKPSSSEGAATPPSAARPAPRRVGVQVLPAVGPQGGSLAVLGTF